MTQADFNSKYGRLSMPCPFGNNDSANITQIASTAAAGDFNFETGFATPYSSPKSNGGKFVTRKEINAIGNLASRNVFYRMCGGLNTFDPNICISIGGYHKGAILDYVEVTNYKYIVSKVISLIDSNKVDFTSSTIDQDLISKGIVNGSVDNVNWAFCNEELATPSSSIKLFDFPSTFPIYGFSMIGRFTAPANGNIAVKGSYSIGNIYNHYEASTDINSPGTLLGAGIIIYEVESGSTPTFPDLYVEPGSSFSWGNWKQLYAIRGLVFWYSAEKSLGASLQYYGKTINLDYYINQIKKGSDYIIAAASGPSFDKNGNLSASDPTVTNIDAYIELQKS